jgi:K+-transporting ATPase ATPase C chain
MKQLMSTLKLFLLLTILTGLAYPFLITGIAGVFFPWKAGGSIIWSGNRATGSALIGQEFDSTIYFSSRPSSTNYNTLPSGGSNYSLTNSKLRKEVDERIRKFRSFNQTGSEDIPSEMVFASASGLDPHISVNAALLQVDRIARSRHFTDDQKMMVYDLIKKHTEHAELLFPGEESVNVLLLNLDLDKIK